MLFAWHLHPNTAMFLSCVKSSRTTWARPRSWTPSKWTKTASASRPRSGTSNWTTWKSMTARSIPRWRCLFPPSAWSSREPGSQRTAPVAPASARALWSSWRQDPWQHSAATWVHRFALRVRTRTSTWIALASRHRSHKSGRGLQERGEWD